MPDQTLEILIKTKAELAGALQVQQSLERQIGKLKAQGKEYKEVEAQLVRVKAATDDYINKNKVAQEEVENLTVSHHELLGGIRALATIGFPEAAHAAHLFLHPLGIAVAGIIGGFVEWYYRVEHLEKVFEDFQTPDLGPHVQQVDHAVQLWLQLNEAVRTSVQNYNSAEEASKRLTAQLDAEYDAKKKIMEADKAAELAALEGIKGSIGEGEYIRRKFEIEQRYAQAGIAAEHKHREDIIAEEKKKADALEAEQKRLAKAAADIHISNDDADTKKRVDAARAAAQAEMQAIQQTLADIAEVLPVLNGQKTTGIEDTARELAAEARLAKQFGFGAASKDFLLNIRGQLEQKFAGAIAAIQAADAFDKTTAPNREAQRKQKADDEAQANKDAAEAAKIRAGIGDQEKASAAQKARDQAVAAAQKKAEIEKAIGADAGGVAVPQPPIHGPGGTFSPADIFRLLYPDLAKPDFSPTFQPPANLNPNDPSALKAEIARLQKQVDQLVAAFTDAFDNKKGDSESLHRLASLIEQDRAAADLLNQRLKALETLNTSFNH